MRKKISVLIVMLLMCLSSVLIMPDELKVEASGGGGGGGGGGNVSTFLDYDYLWNRINDISKVIYYGYNGKDIRKGRFFGSKGAKYAAEEIIEKQMNNTGLENVKRDKIEHNDPPYNDRNYTTLIDAIGYNLTVNNESYDYSYVNKSEFFPIVSAKKNESTKFTYNTNFSNSKIKYDNFRAAFPYDNFDKNYIVNDYITFKNSEDNMLWGKLVYITADQSPPSSAEQQGNVYLFEENAQSQKIIDDISDADGCILIEIGANPILDISSKSYSINKINQSSGNDIKEILDTYSDVHCSDLSGNLTIYYDLNDSCYPNSEFVVIDRIPDHHEVQNSTGAFILTVALKRFDKDDVIKPHLGNYLSCYVLWAGFYATFVPNCKGIILYSSFDHYWMIPTATWWGDGDILASDNKILLPTFCVNYSLGNFTNSTRGGNSPTTISGYINQTYYEETAENIGVEAYNVIGELNINKSPDDQRIIISNRYDGMWGQTPGDSGIGTAIVLALAKQLKNLQQNYSVNPRYNITFLFTTGEEVGARGAQYAHDKLIISGKENDVKLWIGFDQLGMNQTDVPMAPQFGGNDDPALKREIFLEIVNDARYEERNNIKFDPYKVDKFGGTEGEVWTDICDVIQFARGNKRRWDRWHTTGINYTQGDSLNYTNSTDVDLTYEISWNLTKYFAVDPDCWFQNISHELWDSPDDDNDIPDHLNVSYSIKTCMPHDRVKVRAILYQPFGNFTIEPRIYQITSGSTKTDYINFSLDKKSAIGRYALGVYLYNSTGEIKDYIFQPCLPGDYANASYILGEVYSSSVYMNGLNDVPYKTSKPTSITPNMKAGTSYSYTTNTTDFNGDQIFYQWDFMHVESQKHEYSSWIGPFDSGQNCTVNHTWTTIGDKQVCVRARDEWFSPNLWSNWSNPLNISVESGCSIVDAPTVQVVNLSFTVNGEEYGFEAANWSWDFGAGEGVTDYTATVSDKSYNGTGDYTINLTVKDDGDNEYYFESDVQVVSLKASYTLYPWSGVQPLETIAFNDTSEGEFTIVNWTWDFDDGNVSYSQNTSHNYSLDGEYNVTLTVKDNQNNTSNCSLKVYVDSVQPEVISVYYSPNLAPEETMPFTYYLDRIGIGFSVSINADLLDNLSGVETVKLNITYPDGSWGNYSMSSDDASPRDYEYVFNDTWQIGQYDYYIWAEDYAGNSNCSSERSFIVEHIFGYTTEGSFNQTVEDRITGSVFTINKNGTADNITAFIHTNPSTPPKAKCMIYRNNDSTLIGTTEELTPDIGINASWVVFNFTGTKPNLVKDTEYVLTCWSNDSCYLYYDNTSTYGRYKNLTYGSPPNPVNWSDSEPRMYSIYCSYTTKPVISNVSNTPSVVGFGFNVTISADVDGNGCGIDVVKVNVSYPDNSSGNFTMNNTGNNTYEYVFNDTWLVGQYNYTIWACDDCGGCDTSSGHSFNVSAQAAISVCTVKDEYGDNEIINLTDPPGDPPLIGYMLLDDGDVLRIWNKFDSYYFDIDSGMQITNHYDEYWSHNVLMLGYYDGDEWNLIYRTDELNGFNKDIDSDDETFVNVTLWKDLTYKGYDFRLAIRYYLGVDDNELTVIPYIKNIDQSDIPYILGFGWEMKDIQIDMTETGDYINVNRTMYYLNQTLNNTYTDLSESEFYLMENITGTNTKSLYLKWNQSLTYKLQVKSRDGQYNAPVTLFVRIGTLNSGQEKYTKMYWYDADQVTYYFNSYDNGEAWATNPSYMVDGNGNNYASTTIDGDIELCDGNNCSGSDLGVISKVELRICAYYSGGQRNILLRPVFGGSTDGLNIRYTPPGSGGVWSPWFDITNDPSAPGTWTWSDVDNLDCDVEVENDPFGLPFTMYSSKVDIRVTYTVNNPPVVSDPYPSDGSENVSISPMLNITVSDADGNTMNISWLSNSSGSWQVFGTNNSVNNGTYHQIFNNATENGKWWYWKVNVSDGTDYVESSVYKFYTGYQSKIKNTGSYDIKGYLLIQVHYYNTTNSTWIVADDTINETTPRTINTSGQLGLDTVFNGLLNTSVLSYYGNGTYRIYAAFRDIDGNVLVCNDESELNATYEFTITFE